MGLAAEIRPGSVQERELERIAALLRQSHGAARLVDADGVAVDVPDALVGVLGQVVDQLRAGNGVTVAPLYAELSTFDAAEILNVSRPHVIKLIDRGDLAHRMVGTHRRLRLLDVLEYRDRQEAASTAALDELTREAEELGLYD